MLVEHMQLTLFLLLLQPLQVVFKTMNKPMTKVTVLLPIKTRLQVQLVPETIIFTSFSVLQPALQLPEKLQS